MIRGNLNERKQQKARDQSRNCSNDEFIKGKIEYQVFSTYSIKPEDYYINTIYNNDDEFNEFLNKVKSRTFKYFVLSKK